MLKVLFDTLRRRFFKGESNDFESHSASLELFSSEIELTSKLESSFKIDSEVQIISESSVSSWDADVDSNLSNIISDNLDTEKSSTSNNSEITHDSPTINNVNQINVLEDSSLLSEFDDDEDLDVILNSRSFREELEQQTNLLSPSFNKELIESYKNTNSIIILEDLLKANERLVWKWVLKYKDLATSSHSLEDMKQDGLMGLMKAVEKFDSNCDFEFSTYAVHWIRQGILRGVMDKSLLIRLPVHMFEKIRKLVHLENTILGEKEVDNYLYKELDVDSDQLNQIRRIREQFFSTTSLNTLVGEDSSLEDFMPSLLKNPEMITIENSLSNELSKKLSKLKPREEEVLRLRFGLTDEGRNYTLEEIGSVYGLTRERIRQIESKALDKLRKEDFTDFL